jgi:hypothetical protein
MEDLSFSFSKKFSFQPENWRDVVKVHDRKLIIQVHNTWNVVDEQSVTLKNNKDGSELEASSIIKMEDVFIDYNIAIVFMLEYMFKIKTTKSRKDNISIRIGYLVVMPEAEKTEFKRSSFISDFQTGPHLSLDGAPQWVPINLVNKSGREEPMEFILKGIMAPTETLRKLKSDKDEPPKIIKVENQEDKERLLKYEREQIEKERQFNKEKDTIKLEEKKLREKAEYEVRELKRKMNEIKEADILNKTDKSEESKLLLEKIRKIEELELKLDETLKKPQKEKSPKRKDKDVDRSRILEKDEENIDTIGKRTIVKTGMDADEVMKLIKTVIESTQAGIPLETHTLGKTGAMAQTLPEDFLKDLEIYQKDKVNFIGSKGGSTVMSTTSLTRRDKIHLMKLGLSKGLMDGDLGEFIAKEPSLEKELADPNVACKVLFKFVVLRTDDKKQNVYKIPAKLFMTFKFFTFPESNTTLVKLVENNSDEEPRKIRTNKSYGLVRVHYDENQADVEDRKACRVEFRVDPSVSKVKDENLALVRYLKERVMSVDVFDAYSKLHVGTIKVPMVTLLRQGKELHSSGQECDICEPQNGRCIGKLQIIMTNHVVPPADLDSLKFSDNRGNQPSQKRHRYKHVKSKPLLLTQIGEGGFQQHLTTFISNQATENNEEARIQLKIERMKQKKMQKTVLEPKIKNDGIDEWEKKTALTHCNFIREQQKDYVIENLIKSHKTIERDLEVAPGEPKFMTILISNPTRRADVFSVKFEDPDELILHKPEFGLVHNYGSNNEWRYWFENGKCTEPPVWDMVDDGGNIYLDPDQQCPLLFKFFSYREATFSKKKSVLSDPTTLTPRRINVKIYQQSDESLVKNITVTVIPRPNPIDHVFRFYEPENRYSTITLPTFTSLPISGFPDLFIESSNPKVTPSIGDNNQVHVELRTPFSPEISVFSVYIYQDSFRNHILAACDIRVHSLTSVFAKVRTGVRKPINLPVTGDRRNQSIMVYTDDPEVASEVSQRPIEVESVGSTNVQLTVKT